MQLEVETLDGRSFHFIVCPYTPLQKVFVAFCLRLGVSLSDARFLYNSKRLCGYETPSSEEMQPGDSITWIPTQLGD